MTAEQNVFEITVNFIIHFKNFKNIGWGNNRMKYVSIALLTSLALVGCSKPKHDDVENKELTQKIEKMSLNDDAPAQAVSSPLIIPRNKITPPLTKTGENFQELIKDEGYFSFIHPIKPSLDYRCLLKIRMWLTIVQIACISSSFSMS